MIDDYEFVPGTIHLVDVDGILDVKKDTGNDSNIILQPQPSSNPNDPLRWSKKKKYCQFALLWFWGFMLAVSANFIGPAYDTLIEDLDTGYWELNVASALVYLFLGLGCLFLQPTALKFGRRMVYLMCTVLVMLAMVIGGVAKNIQYIYGSFILIGFAAAPVDSLMEISSADVFFQHERSTAFALIILALYAGSDLGPVVAGFIVNTMSWRWLFWIQLFIYAGLIIVQVLFMYDTMFYREDHEDELEHEIISCIKSHESVAVSPGNEKEGLIVEEVGDDSSLDSSIPIRSHWQKLKIVEREYNDPRSWFTIFWRPFLLISFPAVVWSGVIYGAQIMWLSLMSVTQSMVFAAPPYNFSPIGVGLTNLAPLVGSCVGMLYGGNFVDWLSIKLSKRNKGIFEPEMRLYGMVVPLIANAAGLVAYGIGANAGVAWPLPVVLGYGLLGFCMSSSGAICLSYAFDSYHKLGSEAMVLILFIRNIIGMVFCFVFEPWLNGCGLSLTTWLMFMLSIVLNGTFVVMIIYGKTFRRWTATRYKKYSDPMFGEIWKGV